MPAFLLAPLTRWLAVGGVLLVLGGWLWAERTLRHDAEARADRAEATVAARDKAIAGLEHQAREAAARTARFATLRRSVDAAPATQACADAPALRAALDGLRARPAAGAGGAAQPAGVRGRTGGP